MATAHFTVKYGKAGTATAHADYILREGKYFYGPKREELVYKAIGNLPEWAEDARDFWQAADRYERIGGRVFYEFEIALPNELSYEQNIDLVNDFIKMTIGDKKFYTYAIHDKDASLSPDKRQIHAHIMFCEREFDRIDRTRELFFKRANTKNPERGGAKKDDRFTARNRKGAEKISEIRMLWQTYANHHLAKNGFENIKINMASYEKQMQEALAKDDLEEYERLNMLPKEIHLGPKLASKYKRVSEKLKEYSDKEKYFLNDADEKSRQVFLSKTIRETQEYVRTLEREVAECKAMAADSISFAQKAVEEIEANDYYIQDIEKIKSVYDPQLDKIKAEILNLNSLKKDIESKIIKPARIQEFAEYTFTNGKNILIEKELNKISEANHKWSEKYRLFSKKPVPSIYQIRERLAYYKEQEQLKKEDIELRGRTDILNKKYKELLDIMKSPQGRKAISDIYAAISAKNDVLKQRLDNINNSIKEAWEIRSDLLRDKSMARIIHNIKNELKNVSEQSKELDIKESRMHLADSRKQFSIYIYDRNYHKFMQLINGHIDKVNENVYMSICKERYLQKHILSDEKINKLARSYAVNFKDRALEKEALQLKEKWKKLHEFESVYRLMDIPDRRDEGAYKTYIKAGEDIQKTKNKLTEAEKHLKAKEYMLKREFEIQKTHDNIKKFSEQLHNKNDVIMRRIELYQNSIKSNSEIRKCLYEIKRQAVKEYYNDAYKRGYDSSFNNEAYSSFKQLERTVKGINEARGKGGMRAKIFDTDDYKNKKKKQKEQEFDMER